MVTWKPQRCTSQKCQLPNLNQETYQLTFETDLEKFYGSRTGNSPPPDMLRLVSPFEWSRTRKNATLAIACWATTFASVAASIYSPGEAQMASEWEISNVAAAVGVTTFTTGFAVAPMVLAPTSEIKGRRVIFMATGFLWFVATLCCAVTRTYGGMLVSRFLAGMGSSTFSTMIGGLIADLYHTEDRNAPLALFSGAAVIGIGLGPLIGGFIAQYTSWRWIFWLQTIVVGVTVSLLLLVVKESRSHVVLQHKALELQKWQAKNQKVDDDKENDSRVLWTVDAERPSLRSMIATSVLRPFELLFREPVVFVFSLWAAFSWSILYACLSVVPLVYEDIYKFTLSEATSVFAAPCVSVLLATFVGVCQEPLGKRYNILPSTPEARLFFCCFEAWLLPAGLFLFGWTLQPFIHWIVPAIGVGVATAGIFFVYLAVFNYLADNYGLYASSAIAAQSFCRNALGGSLPLFTQQMYKALGYSGASSLLGGIAAVLSLVPLVLLFKGDSIRASSRFAGKGK